MLMFEESYDRVLKSRIALKLTTVLKMTFLVYDNIQLQYWSASDQLANCDAIG